MKTVPIQANTEMNNKLILEPRRSQNEINTKKRSEKSINKIIIYDK